MASDDLPPDDELHGTPLMVPGQLGPVWLLTPLMAGGHGDVFVGTISVDGDDNLVVVKRLRPGLQLDPDDILDSAYRAMAFSLPHVAHVQDAGAVDGHVWVASDFIEGADVDVLLREHEPVAADVATAIVADVLRGLVGLHAQGLVHRDVSAANVMVGIDGYAGIVDVDLLVPSGTAATDYVPGNPAYMSPEQATGLPVDGRGDLVGAGVVLAELLCGRPYYSDLVTAEGFDVWRLARTGGYKPTSLNAVPSSLRDVIVRCVAPDPTDRFQSAELALHALLAAHDAASPEQVAAVVDERAGARVRALRARIEAAQRAPRPRPLVSPVIDPFDRPITQVSASIMRPRSGQTLQAALVVAALLALLVIVLALRS